MPDEPKIIVDDDWKKQARAEKAKLAEAEKAAQERAAQAKAAAAAPLPGMGKTPPEASGGAGASGGTGRASGGAAAPGGAMASRAAATPDTISAAPGADVDESGAPYKVDFSEVIRMLGTQALMYLGQFPDPQTGKAIIALDVAKVQIDMLGVLEEKTRGNLTPQEESDLKGLLGELRMIFVEISRGVAKAMQEGRIGPRGEVRAPGAAGAGPMGPLGAQGGAML